VLCNVLPEEIRMPCPPSSAPPHITDGVFDVWLEQRLTAERSIIVEQLQDLINRRLESHRTALLSEVTECLGTGETRTSNSAGLSLINCTNHVPVRIGETATKHANSVPPLRTRGKSADSLDILESSETQPEQPGTPNHKSHNHLQEDDEDESPLQRFVGSTYFELTSLIMIMINTLQLALEIEYGGYDTGYVLKIDGYTQPASAELPGFADAFKITSWVFCGLFIMELVLRIASSKSAALRSGWIWCDTVLVFLGVLDVMEISLVTGVNPTMMRLLRIARLVRLGKVIRKSSSLDSLFLLIKSIQASYNSLIWSFLLLGILQTAVGMILAQYFTDVMRKGHEDQETKTRLFLYFGTFSKTMVTMFEISVGNWVPTCRFLMTISDWFGLFYIMYRCMLCFAVVSVIGAVFVAETGRVAANDDNVAMMRKQREQQAYSRKVLQLFSDLDADGDGKVSWTEFQVISTDKVMQNYLATFDIDTTDLYRLFQVLDDGDGNIEVEEFVSGMCAVRGVAKSFDIVKLSKMVKKLDRKLNEVL